MRIVTMFAGANGSGKTHLAKSLIDQGIEFGEYLNADDIAVDLEGNPRERIRDALRIVRDRKSKALEEGRDYCWETVMAHPAQIDHLLAARKKGYRIRIFYIGIASPQICLNRVWNRVQQGGHDVPQGFITGNYTRSLNLLPKAVLAADEAHIYDNSTFDPGFEFVGRLYDDLFETPMSLMKLPLWLHPTIAALEANAK